MPSNSSSDRNLRTPATRFAEQLKAGWQQRDAGRPKQAERIARELLVAAPTNADALHLLGLVLLDQNNRKEALETLRRARSQPGVPPVLLSNFAEICRQEGLLAEGEKAARQAVTLAPTLIGAWNNLGIILQEAGKLTEAMRCLERVVRAQPNNAPAHNNLANTAKRLGLITKARAHWQRAIQLQPEYADAYSNLSILLNEEAEYDQAAAAASKAIRLQPKLADAYVNLAAVYSAQRRYVEALNVLARLDSFAPDSVPGLTSRAAVYLKQDRVDDAVMVAERASLTNPHSADAQVTLAQSFQAAGRFDDAGAAYERAAQLPGTAAERALVAHAVMFMERGLKEEALAAFDRVLQRFPHSASALFNRADLEKFKPGDPAIGKLEQLLAAPEHQSRSDRTSLNFALGKAYLDLGESERAFAYLNEGNRLKREKIFFDSAATSAWMKSIADTFTAGLMARLEGLGKRSTQPIFVLGMPRSGTTLLEQILGAHPSVQGAGELRYLQKAIDGIGPYPPPPDALTPDALVGAGEAYLASTKPLRNGKAHVVDKMPANFLRAGLLHLILPDARIIHSRRDPVDTCLSCYSKLFAGEQPFTYNLAELGRFHRDYQQLMEYWRAVLPPSHFIEMDYEAMVEDQEGETRRLIEWLGLPWDDACLEFYKPTGVVKTASVNQVRQPIYKSSAGRWKPHEAQLQPLLNALRKGVAEQ